MRVYRAMRYFVLTKQLSTDQIAIASDDKIAGKIDTDSG
jgi:hypothetical protein